MKYSDLFEETYSAITVNKARSGLTILGIVIGVGAVIAMVSIGQGAQSSIASSIESIGSNLIQITPSFARGVGQQVSAGRGSAQTLKLADADAIASQVSGISAVAPQLALRNQVTAKGKNTNTQILGTSFNYPSVRNLQIGQGNFFTDQNDKSSSKVAVLGPAVRDDLFGTDADAVGQTVKINKIEFKIIGVTQSKGASGFNNQDDIIYIPLQTATHFLSGEDFLSTISVQVTDQSQMTDVQNQITALLLSRHNISDPSSADFNVLNQADIVSAASSVTKTFTILLAAIASISLLVGGIGIMNMMLTTVTERTREIGLRKAIGGKNQDISLQFLAESIMLTLIGGVLGIGLGWLLAWGVTKFGNIATKISVSSILLACGVSAAIGLIFGFYPARRAAKLNPIEALRYE